MKKFLFLFLVIFIFLNVVDKATTYVGMQRGFIELNSKAVYFFNQFGVLSTIIVQMLVVLGSSILLYKGINKLSEKVKYIHAVVIIPIVFIIGIYTEAVVNNVRLLV